MPGSFGLVLLPALLRGKRMCATTSCNITFIWEQLPYVPNFTSAPVCPVCVRGIWGRTRTTAGGIALQDDVFFIEFRVHISQKHEASRLGQPYKPLPEMMFFLIYTLRFHLDLLLLEQILMRTDLGEQLDSPRRLREPTPPEGGTT